LDPNLGPPQLFSRGWHCCVPGSNGYCRPDVLRMIGLACSDEFSSFLSIRTKVHLYQALVRSVLLKERRPCWSQTWIHWRLSAWDVSDSYLMYAGGFMSPMQRCFSDLVCQPLVTYYVIDACLCLAMLYAIEDLNLWMFAKGSRTFFN